MSLQIKQSLLQEEPVFDSGLYLWTKNGYSRRQLYFCENPFDGLNCTEMEIGKTKETVKFPSKLDCVNNYKFYEITLDGLDELTNIHIGTKMKRIDNGVYFWKNKAFFYVEIVYCTDESFVGRKGFLLAQLSNYPDLQRIDKNVIRRRLRQFIHFILSYSMLWTIISDILLMIQIYAKKDIRFFILALVFSVGPLSIVSGLICCCSNEYDVSRTHWKLHSSMYYIPCINIPSYAIIQFADEQWRLQQNAFSLFLTAFMTYPLYLLNLSFMLEKCTTYQDISIYNGLQFMFSLISLISSPFMSMLNVANEIQKDYLIFSFLDKVRV
eukprot:545392_1